MGKNVCRCEKECGVELRNEKDGETDKRGKRGKRVPCWKKPIAGASLHFMFVLCGHTLEAILYYMYKSDIYK